MTRHVFIGLLGGSPAVITEALWALLYPEKLIDPARRGFERIVPATAHIICTSHPGFFGDTDERERVIREKIESLFKQAGDPPPDLIMAPAPDPNNADLGLIDIRTQAENTAMAHHIAEELRKYTEKPDTVVHFSLAGGRKTMSSHAQSAMMFFGRRQDELFHILLTNPAYESFAVRDFWYPDQKWPARLMPPPGSSSGEKELSATHEDVGIDLIDVPFVRLDVRLPGNPPPEALDPDLIVEFLEFERGNDPVVLDFEAKTVTAGRNIIRLEPVQFALYTVYAVARHKCWRGAGPREEGVGDNASGWVRLDDLKYGMKDENTPNPKPALLLLRGVLWELDDNQKERDNDPDYRLADKSIAQRAMNSHPFLGNEDPNWGPTRTHLSDEFNQEKTKRNHNSRLESPLIASFIAPDTSWPKRPVTNGLNIAPERIRFENFPNWFNNEWLEVPNAGSRPIT